MPFSLTLCFLAVIAAVAMYFSRRWRMFSPLALIAAVIAFLLSCFSSVPASSVGVVTTFGRVSTETLASGAHLVLPWQKVTPVYLGQQTATVTQSEASSHDLQMVHSNLVTNIRVHDPLALYQINTTLNYVELIVEPAIQEVFKAVVAGYTAEELITKRQQVSEAITDALSERLKNYYITVQNVNLTNFGFSKNFNDAIEAKVTASQNAETAKRNLEKVQYEAQQNVERARGQAEAIRIQSEAIQRNGGEAYVQLQAIEKWDGKLPQYMTSGAAVPFVPVK